MSYNKFMPNFFVIGAQKSATTTIHNWLKQHNEISLPIIKETHFFSDSLINGNMKAFRELCQILADYHEQNPGRKNRIRWGGQFIVAVPRIRALT